MSGLVTKLPSESLTLAGPKAQLFPLSVSSVPAALLKIEHLPHKKEDRVSDFSLALSTLIISH